MKHILVFSIIASHLVLASPEDELPIPVNKKAQKVWLMKSKKIRKRSPSFSTTHRLEDLQVNQSELNTISSLTSNKVRKISHRPEIIQGDGLILDERVGQ